ncbi:MAG: glycosyltransferase family 2 protein [Candidatus Bathyarchaeota archaeon]|nr:glycosyltransferase family 2 protein [Candidatus Bathyarchaeota archaeon]
MKPFIVACIPAYNEHKAIAHVIQQASKQVEHVIVCDDGSTDETLEIAEKNGALVISNPTNLGKGAALRKSLELATKLSADLVVMLDADGQHDPSDIPKLLRPLMRGEADLVIGSRYMEGSKMDPPAYRKIGLKVINSLSQTSLVTVKDTQSGFRAFNKKALRHFVDSDEDGFGVETEQLATARKFNLRVQEVPISVRYSGLDNTSKKNPVSHGFELVTVAIKLLVQDKPLLMIGTPGLLFIATSMFTGYLFVKDFNLTGYFSVPMALITFTFLTLGTLFILSSFIFYAIYLLKLEIKKIKVME